jgi:endogenous inhibitor of DNA gyrase (YacG/DUF329 family)
MTKRIKFAVARCPQCGDPFRRNASLHTYCSEACRNRARRERVKAGRR